MIKRILVVEDEPLIAMMITSMLRELDYVPLGPTHTPQQTLDFLDETPIDAALLDLNLSAVRSDSIAERLDDLDIPFAFVSGYTAAQLPVKFQDRPFISKPLTQRSLAKALKRLEEERSLSGGS